MRQSEDVWTRLDSLGPGRVRPGLQRIRALLETLGAPQLAYPTAVIGGTNGKGSVAAMLAAICRAAGHRVGCYTSPHLSDLEERFQVDGRPISRQALARQLEVVFEAADALLASNHIDEAPSYFEILTATTFRYFAEASVDLAILEVGLGGRWDAINVTRPRVSVLTQIAVDHEEFLGKNLSAIAAEKSATVPTGGLAVVAPQVPAVREVIRRYVDSVGATLWESEHYPLVLRRPDKRLRYTIDCFGRLRGYVGLEIALAGAHQAENARCALLAAEALDRHRLRIGSDAIWAGLRSVQWPGRCEWVGGSRPVLLDVAHNPAASRALASHLTELRLRGAFDKLHLVFGALADKDVEGMAKALYPAADSLVITEPPSPRALPATELQRLGSPPTVHSMAPDPAVALRRARENASAEDLVCVTGSCYLVGALRPCLLADRPED
ncbi:MAG: bifunctional folylpolyglutamate synthase/dihydrofolate synthase [Acidobacteriota bacterium]